MRVLTIVLATCAVAGVAQNAALKKQLESLYMDSFKGTQKKDVDHAVKHLSPSFIGVSQDGSKKTYKDVRFSLRQQFLRVSKFKDYRVTIDKLTTRGNQAVVEIREVLNVEVPDPKGLPHELKVNSKSRQTWLKTNGAWKVVRSDNNTTETFLDGKRILMPTPRR